jgi:Na+/melibiose symporter-like transporter
MGAAIFFSIGILFLLSIPIITSRLAKRMGRDPNRWFFIGLLLPVIATFILFFLPDLSEKEK